MIKSQHHGLRLAIGIQGTGRALSESDYFRLYEFDPLDCYEPEQAFDIFRENHCPQVGAESPAWTTFNRVYQRHLAAVQEEE